MDQPTTERVIQWLKDAHSMEAEAQSMLTTMSSRVQHYPELLQRIDRHLIETQGQSRRIEVRLQALGSSPSMTQSTIAHGMGMMLATGTSMMSDEVIKGLGINYAFEHLEIAAYRSLLIAAEAVGDEDTARLCRETLPEEEAMAAWLEQNLPALVQQFLVREQTTGVDASR